MLRRSKPDSRRSRAAVQATSAVFGGALLATLASQHPHRSFDGLRRFDVLNLFIPNWRFFAPEPAQHDFHVLYRTLDADDVASKWQQTSEIAPRTWGQVLFFADRRREKGMFDVAGELLSSMNDPRLELSQTPAYRLIRDAVRLRIEAQEGPRPAGFQFLLARDTGWDTTESPEYILASPFIEL